MGFGLVGIVHAHNATLHCMFLVSLSHAGVDLKSSSADTVVFLEPHVPGCPVREFCLYYPYDVGLVWFTCLCVSRRSNTAQTLVPLQPLQHGTLLCCFFARVEALCVQRMHKSPQSSKRERERETRTKQQHRNKKPKTTTKPTQPKRSKVRTSGWLRKPVEKSETR